MVVRKSPDWLPPGFIEKVKYKNGRKVKYYVNVANDVIYNSKKEVIQATEEHAVMATPQKENGDQNALSIENKVDVISTKANGSPAWLPNGWIMEERARHSGSSKDKVYKVYSELSSGKKFYSKAAVTRYLHTLDPANTMTVQNQIDNVDKPSVGEPSTGTSLQLVSTTNTGDVSNVDNKPNVDAASRDTSLQLVCFTNTGGVKKTKRKSSSYSTVATQRITDNDLPPGWIKEIKISKSGNKTRRDPFYTDPVSGYVFRSKKDAMRYLDTKDIRNCACKPLKIDLDGIKLNESPSSTPANEDKRLNLLDGKLNGGEEPSGTKGVAASETNTSKQKQGHFESDSLKVEEKISSENSEKKNAEIINYPAPESDTKKDSRVVAISSPITGPSTQVKSSKSKKRKSSALPSRTSKRLAGNQSERAPIVNLSEHSLMAAARTSADESPDITVEKPSASVEPLPSEIEQSRASVEPLPSEIKQSTASVEPLPSEIKQSTASVEPMPSETEQPTANVEPLPSETKQPTASVEPLPSEIEQPTASVEPPPSEIEQPTASVEPLPSEIEQPTASFEPLPSEIEQPKAVPEESYKGDESHQERLREIVENLFNDVDEPSGECPDVQMGGEKQIDESKKAEESSQLCYDFGDAWSDPLEFAFKTLMGEISIDNPLTFPGCFNEQDNGPQNRADEGFKQSQSDVARNDFAESSKQVGPSSSSASPLGDIGFGSIDRFNCPSSNDVGKKDFQPKFNP